MKSKKYSQLKISNTFYKFPKLNHPCLDVKIENNVILKMYLKKAKN